MYPFSERIPLFLYHSEETIIFQIDVSEIKIINIHSNTKALLCNCIVEAEQGNLTRLIKSKLTHHRDGYYKLSSARIEYSYRPKIFFGSIRSLVSSDVEPIQLNEKFIPWRLIPQQIYLRILNYLGYPL